MPELKLPAHLSDPGRIALAAEVTQKELRKLFPSVPESQWPELDKDVTSWFDGAKSELAPVQDFWNGCEGITQGFKLKRLVRYISAQNITWTTEDYRVKDIPLGWKLPTLSDLGDPPYTAEQIQQRLATDSEFRKRNEEDAFKHRTSSVPRDHYPIFIVVDSHDTVTLLDGNRRMRQAILDDKATISAHVGRVKEYHDIHNYWVGAPFLRNLVRVAETGDESVVEGVKTVLRQLFKETDVARLNYENRVCNQSDLAQQLYDELT